MQIIDGIPVWGDPQPNAVEQMKNALKADAVGGALMADHHLGYAVPVGGVVAYHDKVSPSGVGFDIACGNKAVMTDMRLDDMGGLLGAGPSIAKIMDDVVRHISFGVGRNNNEPFDHPLFDDEAWNIPAANALKRKAAGQLGTVGSGNHYVDIFHDELDRIWIGCHFGSRGFGHGIATHYIKAGGGKDGINVDPVVLDVNTDLGREYIATMNLAGRYAYAGRDWVCERVAKILGAKIVDEVHNHHNFAWPETHIFTSDAGAVWQKDYWVVRKGATPAFPGQRGFIGGTMAENAVIIEGVNSADGRLNYYSTVHGAGRVLSRTQAAGRRKWKRRPGPRCIGGLRGKGPCGFIGGVSGDTCPKCGGEVLETRKTELEPSGGCVSNEMMQEWIKKAGVELRGAGVDESPHCYKRLDEVLAAHSESIKILHTLTPIGVAMAGANEYDPYKD